MTQENFSKWESTVRDYELDAQGIVNNATYINYFEQCRNNYGRSFGIDYYEFHKAGFDFVVAALEVQYRYPLRAGDEYYVTAKITGHDEKRIHFEQEIHLKKEDKLAAKAAIHIACVNCKTGKSCIPELLLEKLPTILA